MRLLLAEDEKELSEALQVILEHHNFAVDAVENGRDALDYLVAGDYDGAILDIMMPQLDGLTVVRRAREQGLRLPILLLTAKGEVGDRVVGLDSGADDYLPKPFATQELLARIRAMTRRQPTVTGNVLSCGNLSLDRATYQLSTQEGQLRLANKEFQIMEILMTSPNQPIPTERLMEKIWGYDSEAEINVVWVYVSYLRKKLASLASTAEIKAIRNIGYTLEVSR
jgi:two-component system, OmpR family, response regulator ArlR